MNERTPRLEFVRLLARAAEAGRVRWDPQGPADDVFVCRAVADGRRYEFRWIWWYGVDGTTLDRQAVVVASDAVAVASTWGTEAMDPALRLLATSKPGWREHVRRMVDPEFQTLLEAPEPTMAEPPTVSASWRDYAVAIRDASVRGRLRWERSPAPDDCEIYVAEVDGDRSLVVEMLRPVEGEDRRPHLMAVRVMGLGGAIFAAGTEGMELIREALAASLPDWAATLAAEREALEAECRFLREPCGS
ncbi:hypothetical protein [Paludisphaera soli]|uniref:hypothetical protein n=1 Tax=Paludisphaera soli TaxID=2712865 RepID=UPI0013ED1383|nr:hypothetical protein [Paludisphaera soli]